MWQRGPMYTFAPIRAPTFENNTPKPIDADG